jgi:small-conductance mechanosensitive channel
MFLQEAPPSFSQSVMQKFVYYLNYPFINQAQFKVSLLSLVSLFVVVVVAWAISRYLRRFLEKRTLVQHLDAGLRFTLLRFLHYLILVVGLLYGLKLGFSIDLTSVAVLLGFLSVGIGFGLQYIASDLISGLILLFERPVRVGDRLKIGDVEGRVENIALRTTLILTNDHIAVIVPNSELVRNKFINWSYRRDPVRIRLAVGVAYGSDLDQVQQALIEAAGNVKEALDKPRPSVQLVSFGDSAINLELLVWIDQPHQHPQIRSNINFEIARVFRARKIEIPFSQFDLHLRSGQLQLAARDGEVSFGNKQELEK